MLDGGRRRKAKESYDGGGGGGGDNEDVDAAWGGGEIPPMMSVYLIADLVGFPRPAGAAIYEVKISKTGGGIVVGDSKAVKPSELVFKFDMRTDVVGVRGVLRCDGFRPVFRRLRDGKN